ncbi:MAG: type II toxin-antitoxin system HicB family antitoxin [Castellaniella sp.]|uniref:type II toxin-antitoxin system HicB family antitoxin n=1 Tax=Castellaniella sp. TaxID=1955812 RepID=UPI00121305A4|nr:type II toxin-antitoxin system HicB family antitoxin [Castellaniella sp.]TAN25475.1 MAG: type II toxin-antitoxin system HicB family antitoxin [Castellaniella sp.]
MLIYHYTLVPDDNGTLLIRFPEVPEAAAVAETEAEVPVQAVDGLEAALQMYVDARRPLPVASCLTGPAVALSTAVTAKLLLADEMVRQGVRKADLARLLGVHPPQVDRLLDLGHSSRIESVEAALSALGRHLEVALA